MSDNFSQFFDEPIWDVVKATPEPVAPDWFDEGAYLNANPDVAAAVMRGELRSGYQHYIALGFQEKRLLHAPGTEPRGRLLRVGPVSAASSVVTKDVRHSVEALLISASGGVMVVGWVDDVATPLDHIRISASGWNYTFDGVSVMRFRRRDVEASFGAVGMHTFGFIAFAFLDAAVDAKDGLVVTLGTKDGGYATVPFAPRWVDDVELRKVVLSYVAGSEFFGNHQIEVMRVLDGSIGREIIDHNLRITRGVVAGACAERFGHTGKTPRGSIIVCLYGKPEYLFLQNAMFAGSPGFEDYELIYVSNSPEMAERLMKEAKAAHHVYGLAQTIVLLPGNAGFGAANNVAVNYARSDRILIVNPDVFPRDADWARKHTEAVANLPAHQTRLFGVPLYYNDGSLMHGGMYFEFDQGLSLDASRVTQRRMLRVEHYGKGAPVWASQFTQSRPIQAVTGAFISTERRWYERLGGFTENYVFGHYEDADLCLKSIQAGTAPWIHNIRLWHLEGKGSVRLPVHEGGSLVNRWLFTQTWEQTVADGLEGQAPTHRMMRPSSDSPIAAPPTLASRVAATPSVPGPPSAAAATSALRPKAPPPVARTKQAAQRAAPKRS